MWLADERHHAVRLAACAGGGGAAGHFFGAPPADAQGGGVGEVVTGDEGRELAEGVPAGEGGISGGYPSWRGGDEGEGDEEGGNERGGGGGHAQRDVDVVREAEAKVLLQHA